MSEADLINYFDTVLQMMRTAAEGWGTRQDATAAGTEGDWQQATSDSRDLLDFMAQASLAWMHSGFSYWRGWAAIYASYYPVIMHNLQMMNADPNRGGEARGVLIDTLRASLREMAELPWQESRRLQAELEKIAGEVWPPAAAGQEGHHRRRAKVKQ